MINNYRDQRPIVRQRRARLKGFVVRSFSASEPSQAALRLGQHRLRHLGGRPARPRCPAVTGEVVDRDPCLPAQLPVHELDPHVLGEGVVDPEVVLVALAVSSSIRTLSATRPVSNSTYAFLPPVLCQT
jgi:hypothetical protein